MAYCALYMCIKTYHLNHAGSCIYTNSICIVGEKNDWYHTNYQLPKQLYIQPVTVDPLLKNCYTIHYISNCVQLCIVLLIKMCSLVKNFVGGGREKHLWWYNKLAHWQLLGIHNNTYSLLGGDKQGDGWFLVRGHFMVASNQALGAILVYYTSHVVRHLIHITFLTTM